MPGLKKMKTKHCECGCGEIVKRRFLPGHQARMRDLRMGKNPHWKGGMYINDGGYRMAYMPTHHRASSNGYVREHILLAEKVLGKPLPEGAQIHHPGDKCDNGSIVICQNQEYHRLLHMRERSLSECGNASWRRCKFCKQYDDPENLHITQIKSKGVMDGWNVHHQECERIYGLKRIRVLR